MRELHLNLIKGDKVDDRVDYRDALSQNMLGIMKPILGVAGYMWQQPGISLLGTGAGVDRGGVYNERQKNHFRVSSIQFIEVAENGDTTQLGTVPNNNNDQCVMPYSFNTQGILASTDFFLYDPTNGFRQVTDPELGNPIDVIWVDGYYFFTDGENLYHTNINDEEAIDPLKFATSEFSPDPTVGLGLTADNKVIAFNRYTIEYLTNNANENFAFSRLPSRSTKYGLVGTHLKCEIGGTWYFVGGPKEGSISVYQLVVGKAIEIASREVTQRLSAYDETTLQKASMESRLYEEYSQLILHLPNETLIYSIEIGEQQGKGLAWSLLTSVSNTQWRAINGIFEPRLGNWVYGDKATSNIGQLEPKLATQYGQKIECRLQTPFVYLETASIDELDIDTIPGFTMSDDATVFVSITYDGINFSQEGILQYGGPGEFSKRFMAFRLGNVNNYFGLRLRWISESRMAFSRATIKYG